MDKPFKTFDEQVAILNGLNEPNKRKRMNTDSNTKFYLIEKGKHKVSSGIRINVMEVVLLT